MLRRQGGWDAMAAGPDGTTIETLQGELAALRVARDQAQAREAALAEMLEVINASPGDLVPVFEAMLQKAMHLCEAAFGVFGRFDGKLFEAVTDRGVPTALMDAVRQIRSPPPNSGLGRLAAGESVVQLADLADTQIYRSGFIGATALVDIGGAHTAIFVALRKDDALLGAIVMYRREVRSFNDKQIGLLQNFAAQAVIAMENARLMTEQREALEQQTATADILRVISQSPTNVQPVLDAIAQAALRFCGGEDVFIALHDGDTWVNSGHAGSLLATTGGRQRLDRETAAGTAILDGETVHFPDIRALDPVEHANAIRISHRVGHRAVVAAPMLRDGAALGAIVLRKLEVGPFSARQIELLESFAAQAVIALENTRLFTELEESLEQQTATAEILRAISQSPTDVQPVLKVVASAARRFCGAEDVVISLRDGEELAISAHEGPFPLTGGARRGLDRSSVQARAVIDGGTIHVPDTTRLDPAEWSKLIELSHRHGIRAALAAPMLRDGIAVGAVMLRRRDAGPFAPREIELLETFAAQAVIAIENVRLFTELRDSLEQQTATTEILQTINRSPGDPQPVFEAILEKAMTLCDAAFGTFATFDGHTLHTAVTRGVPEPFTRFRLSNPPDYGPETGPGRLIAGEDCVHVIDGADSEGYRRGDPNRRAIVDLGGARTILNVALRKDGILLGVIAIYRQQVRPFSDKQIALLQAFAAQAVIAMENARLLGELRESLDQQTATSDVLKTISRSSVGLEAVLQTLVETVARVCRADQSYMFRHEEGLHHLVAAHGLSDPVIEYFREHPFEPTERTLGGRVIMRRQTVHVADVLQETDYGYSGGQRVAGFRTMLGIPLLAQDQMVGIFVVTRTRVDPFSDKEIALASGFADQAVIAIENARLFEELRDRQAELRVTFDNMGDGMVMFDADLRLASWNRNFQELLDVPDSFLASRPGLEDYVRLLVRRGELGDRDPDKEVARYLDRATRQWSTERTRPDGRVLEVRNNPVPGGGAVLIYSDITDRKKAEAEIRAARDAAEAALERQTATADILKVIASSPTDVQPVLEAVAKAAVRFCGTTDANVQVREGNEVIVAAHEGPLGSPLGRRFPLDDANLFGAAISERRTIQLPDTDAPEAAKYVGTRARAAQFGFRAVISAPMLREDTAVGTISLRRIEPGAFTDQQIELLETFAAQAVIAIENVRLFTELKESLDQQTATADILRAISQSPTDVQPVLDAVVKAAVRFCGATDAIIQLRDGDSVVPFAHEGPLTYDRGERRPMDRSATGSRAIVDAQTCHNPDIEALDPVEFATTRRLAALHGFRAVVAAPLKREDVAIGAVVLRKVEVGPYTPQQIELLETFAAQAVIAIENVRLFTELRQSLDQQTATAEILAVISQSPTDVGPVLSAVARAAMKFCGASDAQVSLREGDEWFIAAHEGPIETIIATRRPLTRYTAPGRAMTDGEVVQIVDLQSVDAEEFSEARALGARLGFRSALAAPLLRDDVSIGAISLRRPEAGPFEPRQIELLKTFAAQAVIAIENVRLFTELRDSLERLKAAQANLVQSEKMATLGQLTAGIAHEIKNPLNFVNNFASLSVELLDELREVAGPALATLDKEKRAELDETMGLLVGNLGKITEHGKRADGIVRSMLSHSRGGSGDWQASDIDALVEEALNLAYHGARAQDKEFNVTLERDFAKAAKPVEVVPQDVTRVFLNLFGNGFYAASKRRTTGGEAGFRPTVKVSTRDLGDAVEVRVRDNGAGIPPEVRAKLFQPFFTTKPTGEGTGLGLSISYDIVTQQHGGTIEVESEVGRFTEFTVRLPRSRRIQTSERAS
jgi:GAF domain-containing protein